MPNILYRLLLCIFIPLAFYFYPSSGLAAPYKVNSPENTVPSVKEVANEVILSIFNQLVLLRGDYPELNELNKSDIQINEFGYYVLQYESRSDNRQDEGYPFEFGVTVVPLNEEHEFLDRNKAIEIRFQLINLKIVAYNQRSLLKQIEVKDVIESLQWPLVDREQYELPLRLTIHPLKDSFSRDEDVVFLVSLQNVSRKTLKVRKLDSSTLAFFVDGKAWDKNSKQAARSRSVVLSPGEKVEKVFELGKTWTYDNFEIRAYYVLGEKGVRPTDKIDIHFKK